MKKMRFTIDAEVELAAAEEYIEDGLETWRDAALSEAGLVSVVHDQGVEVQFTVSVESWPEGDLGVAK